MRFKKDVNFAAFFQALGECSGDVILETAEHDRLNLSSMLSRYLFASLTGDSEILAGATVCCKKKEDYKRLAEFLTESEEIMYRRNVI